MRKQTIAKFLMVNVEFASFFDLVLEFLGHAENCDGELFVAHAIRGKQNRGHTTEVRVKQGVVCPKVSSFINSSLYLLMYNPLIRNALESTDSCTSNGVNR